MTDYTELKRLAEAASKGDWSGAKAGEFMAAANPAAVLSLIADIERQAAQFKEWQASHHKNYCSVAEEREQLRAENEELRQALLAITAQVDGNIRPTVRDCVNGQNNAQDIYGYCDQIESIAAAAMKEPQP